MWWQYKKNLSDKKAELKMGLSTQRQFFSHKEIKRENEAIGELLLDRPILLKHTLATKNFLSHTHEHTRTHTHTHTHTRTHKDTRTTPHI